MRTNDVAIVGAGLSGLVAAAALRSAGRPVTLIDKSRGLGGRLATRRTDVGAFDHGAPAAHGLGPLAGSLAGQGAAEWTRDAAVVGLPGMSGLAAPLAAGCERRAGVAAAALDRAPEGWRVTDAEGAVAGPFAAVLVAIPAPQAAALIGDAAEPLRAVEMVPIWTILAAWPQDGAAAATATAAPGPLNAPIRQRGDGAARWVAHADPRWSAQNLETERDAMRDRLLPVLGAAVGRRDPPCHAAAHRWRYGRARRPLGAPFLDCGGGLLAGGDWALGAEAGHAAASGAAMAARVLADG